jgi:hypothetical protein
MVGVLVLIVGMGMRIVGVLLLLLTVSETVAEIRSESVTVSTHCTGARVRGRHVGGEGGERKEKKKGNDPTLRVRRRLSTI